MAKAVSLDMLKRFASRIGSTFVKKRSGYDLMSNDEKTKLSGIATGANKYVHPAYTARTSGLYKITVDGEGHITAVVAATKADITALGIPGQDTNTTYGAVSASANGLMTPALLSKLNGIAAGANAYSLPVAGTALGGVKSGTDITVDTSGNVSVNNDSHSHGNGTITSVDAGKVNSGVLASARIPNLDASKITSGTISIDRLPAAALERLVTVADQAARFKLTTANVQVGDTVKQTDTGIMYRVVDQTKLNSAAGYVEYTAGSAASVPWSGVTGKPASFTPASHTHNYAGAASAGGSATSAVKLDTASAGSATQPVYFANGKPVACTYALLKSVPANAVFTDTNTWRPVQNVLTSTSTTDALSAAQGKALNDRLKVVETLLDAIIAGGTIVLVDETT